MAPRSNIEVIALARTELEATLWADALRDAGIQAGLFERGVGAALGGADSPFSSFAIVVEDNHALEARRILSELGAVEQLLPETPQGRRRARGAPGRSLVSRIIIAGMILVAVVAVVRTLLG